MNIDDALRELRAADPATRLGPADESWHGSDAERVAHTRLADEPPVATVLSPLPNRHAPRRWLWAASAAVVVAAVSIGVSQLGGSPAGNQAASRNSGATSGASISAGPGQPTDGSGGPAQLPSYPAHPAAATRRLVLAVLARVPALPGAQRSKTNPSSELSGTGGGAKGSHNVFVYRWWTAPGTMADAIAYFNKHVPAGFTSTGSGTGSDHGVVTQLSLSYGADLPHLDYVQPGATIWIQVARHGSGVAVEANVEGTWLPKRSAAEEIVDPTSVTITTWTGPAMKPATHRHQHTFGATQARTLAAIVNGLPTEVPGLVFNCPADVGGHHNDVLTFTTSKGTIRLNVSTFCQPGVGVTADGHQQPALDDGSGTLAKAVSAAMKNY